jgi:anti-sigma-K factor RskA
MSAHQEYADAIAAYALHALDAAEARALEAHLSACAECRAELAELQRAVSGIGLNSIAEEPPADLRAKIVDRAQLTRGTRSARSLTSDKPSSSAIVPWMIAAASIALVAATGFYSLMQRQQTADALAAKAAADARVASMQRQLDGLTERIAVLSAPDAIQIKLAGQPDAPKASASVVMSPTKGMVLTAVNLPQLAAGKIYQLWVVTKQAPVSIGTFEVAADGSVTGTMPLTPGASTDPVAIAVTIEPAGGVPAPTGPKVLVGMLAPQ